MARAAGLVCGEGGADTLNSCKAWWDAVMWGSGLDTGRRRKLKSHEALCKSDE